MSTATALQRNLSPRASSLKAAARLRCNLLYTKVRKRLLHKSPTEFFADIDNLFDDRVLRDLAIQSKGMRKLVAHFRAQTKLNFDLPDILIVYDRLYFFRNFYKCLMACELVVEDHPELADLPFVIDVGSGVGTFGIAWVMTANEAFRRNPRTVVLVDRAPLQLQIGGLIFRQLEIGEPLRLRREIMIEGADVFTSRSDNRQALKLCSYVFGGKGRKLEELVDETFKSIFGPAAVVVDYKNTLDTIAARATKLGYKISRYRMSASLPASYISEIKSIKLTTNVLVIKAH